MQSRAHGCEHASGNLSIRMEEADEPLSIHEKDARGYQGPCARRITVQGAKSRLREGLARMEYGEYAFLPLHVRSMQADGSGFDQVESQGTFAFPEQELTLGEGAGTAMDGYGMELFLTEPIEKLERPQESQAIRM